VRAKEYLKQLGTIMDNLERRQEQLEELRLECCSARAIRYDMDMVQSSGENMVEARILRYLDKSQEIEGIIAYYLEQKNKLIGQIEELAEDQGDKANANYAKLLYKRYVERKKFEMIAREMDYDFGYVRRMHGKALRAFWRMHLRESQEVTFS
jgi:hypothetical protein